MLRTPLWELPLRRLPLLLLPLWVLLLVLRLILWTPLRMPPLRLLLRRLLPRLLLWLLLRLLPLLPLSKRAAYCFSTGGTLAVATIAAAGAKLRILLRLPLHGTSCAGRRLRGLPWLVRQELRLWQLLRRLLTLLNTHG